MVGLRTYPSALMDHNQRPVARHVDRSEYSSASKGLAGSFSLFWGFFGVKHAKELQDLPAKEVNGVA